MVHDQLASTASLQIRPMIDSPFSTMSRFSRYSGRWLHCTALLWCCAAAASSAQTIDPDDSRNNIGSHSGQNANMAPQASQQQVQPSGQGDGLNMGADVNDTRVLRNNGGDAESGRTANRGSSADGDATQRARRSGINEQASLPSEFQRFVETATGRMLPVFGANFFSSSAQQNQGQRSVVNVPVAADYVVGPGDEVMIRAWGSIDVDYRTTVDRNGLLNLPKIGSFNVAGTKASELESQLRAQIGRLYTNFNLNVTLGQLRAVTVFVVGPARRPGVYTLPSQSTVLSAISAAGGPGGNGSMRRITLRRNGTIAAEMDVYDFLVQGDKSKDLQLAPGDVIVFQPVGPRVAINGTIDTPAIYELKTAQEPLQSVLHYAGGAPVLANPNKAQLERIDPLQSKAVRFVQEFKLDASGLQTTLRDGDVLTLLAISPQFANAVTLRGSVAQPLRYPYTPGMRVHDLIPDPEALVSSDFYRRKNVLVQILPEEQHNDFSSDVPARRYGLAPNAAIPGQTAQSRRGSQTTVEQSGDDDTGASDDSFTRTRSSQTPRRAPKPLFNELNWDYATIERLDKATLQTQIIPFNLGKAILQGDVASNFELLPGDVVTIYSQQDVKVPVSRQTRLVSIEGEVGAPGVYQLDAGETLRHLLARAGGFTPQAYVYGIEFSREETRVRQQENLAQAVARLQALSATQTARTAANRVTDATAAQNDAASVAATQVQLSRLSRLQPNGRIALELTPDIRRLDQLPDFPMENADRVIIPPRPGFVTVAGAVVNNNAFLWKPGRTAGDYMRLAGLDEAADAGNMFILRADGTVSSANENRGFFSFGSLESQPLQPGDALIIPNQLDFETWGRALIRNLKDFGQIFSQFGLGIAAIHTLNN